MFLVHIVLLSVVYVWINCIFGVSPAYAYKFVKVYHPFVKSMYFHC